MLKILVSALVNIVSTASYISKPSSPPPPPPSSSPITSTVSNILPLPSTPPPSIISEASYIQPKALPTPSLIISTASYIQPKALPTPSLIVSEASYIQPKVLPTPHFIVSTASYVQPKALPKPTIIVSTASYVQPKALPPPHFIISEASVVSAPVIYISKPGRGEYTIFLLQGYYFVNSISINITSQYIATPNTEFGYSIKFSVSSTIEGVSVPIQLPPGANIMLIVGVIDFLGELVYKIIKGRKKK